MQQRQEVKVEFRLANIQQIQFVSLASKWPDGDMQISNQLQFASDTARRVVRCNASFEYKKNDITQLILTVQAAFEFSRESWSSLYQLQGDEWVLPAGLVQALADVAIGAARGILAVRSEEAGLPRLALPLLNPGQAIRNNLAFKRNPAPGAPPVGGAAGNA